MALSEFRPNEKKDVLLDTLERSMLRTVARASARAFSVADDGGSLLAISEDRDNWSLRPEPSCSKMSRSFRLSSLPCEVTGSLDTGTSMLGIMYPWGIICHGTRSAASDLVNFYPGHTLWSLSF